MIDGKEARGKRGKRRDKNKDMKEMLNAAKIKSGKEGLLKKFD